MKHILPVCAVLFVLLPATAFAETDASADASAEAITRPGDEEGTAAPSDGLAECAAILAATSPRASNIIDRNNMRNSSAIWFSTSGDLAAEEGDNTTGTDVWETKVSTWSERIASVDSMKRQSDWMAYCADMAQTHGLDSSFFIVAAEE